MASLTDTLRVRVSLARHRTKARKPAAVVTTMATVLADRIAALGQRLAAGDLTEAAFVAEVRAALVAGGQEAARVTSLSDAAIEELVARVVDSRADYLDSFASDLADGELSEDAIGARSGLWSGLVWTVYQMAHVESLPEEAKAELYWTCENDAASCEDCRRLDAGSPYTLDSLPTYPAQDVQCNGNCRCTLDGPGGD